MSERSEHTSHIIVNLNFRAKNAGSIFRNIVKQDFLLEFQTISKFSLGFSNDFLQFDFIN